MPSELTTTSYAILGLLAIKPWTTYELAQQMGRALGQFWPRAESKLYEEPKKLVAHGLARASSETVGRRPRTVYSITPKGRRALAAWVPKRGAGPSLEFEQMIKVFFAEHGSKEDLLRTIDGVRDFVEARARLGAGISRAYLEGDGQFPERLPWLILVAQFLQEFNDLLTRWSEWATETVGGWPDDIHTAEPDWATLEKTATDNEEYLARAETRRGSVTA
jgi:PadR family transcriptional regulator, regulatory protein AphA